MSDIKLRHTQTRTPVKLPLHSLSFTWVNPSLMRRCLKVRANCSSSSRSLGSSPRWPPWPPEVKDVSEEAMVLLDADPPPTDVTTPTPLLLVATIEPPAPLLPPTTSPLFSLCDGEEINKTWGWACETQEIKSILNPACDRAEKVWKIIFRKNIIFTLQE